MCPLSWLSALGIFQSGLSRSLLGQCVCTGAGKLKPPETILYHWRTGPDRQMLLPFVLLADNPEGQSVYCSGGAIGIWAPVSHSGDLGNALLGWLSSSPVSVSVTPVSWDHSSHKSPAPKPLSQALLSQESKLRHGAFWLGSFGQFTSLFSSLPSASTLCLNSINCWSLFQLWKPIVLFEFFFPPGDILSPSFIHKPNFWHSMGWFSNFRWASHTPGCSGMIASIIFPWRSFLLLCVDTVVSHFWNKRHHSFKPGF